MINKDKTETKERLNRYINERINKHSYGYALGSLQTLMVFVIDDVPGAAEYVAEMMNQRNQE